VSCTARRPDWRATCSPPPTGTRPTTRSSTSPATSPGGRRSTSAEPRWELPVVGGLAQRAGTALRGRPETGLLLLADLRRLHRKAAGVSLDWELLAQAAQAMRQPDLLELAQSCHPQALRVMRWANAHLKVVSPQVIAS
jgi:hypothetical protein